VFGPTLLASVNCGDEAVQQLAPYFDLSGSTLAIGAGIPVENLDNGE
jgi:hypothetical protein